MIKLEPNTESVALKMDDPVFTYTDGLTHVRRAAINIKPECPEQYMEIIVHCVQKGYIKPIAYMRLTEYVAAKLEQD